MKHLNYFPLINYPNYSATGAQSFKLVPNLLKRFVINETLKGSSSFYLEYIVKDSDRADIISDKLYDDSANDWLVLYMNDMYNSYLDWPQTTENLFKYLQEIYPGQGLYIDIGSFSLPSNRSEFVPDSLLVTDTGQATIQFWNATFQELVVDSVTGTFAANQSFFTQNSEGITFSGTISRVIQDRLLSIHHFEDSDGNVLDPQSRNVRLDSNDLSNMDQYLDGIDSNVVTNLQYEESENNKRRVVKLLQPEYLDLILTEVQTVLTTKPGT